MRRSRKRIERTIEVKNNIKANVLSKMKTPRAKRAKGY